MTGAEIYKIFLNKIDKSYSKFVDKIKLNRLFKMALVNLLEKKYMGLISQKEFDELRYQITTERVLPISNSKVSIAPLLIENVTSNGFLITVKTASPHNLSDNQVVSISGVQGFVTTPPINSTITVYNTPTEDTFTFFVTFVSGTYTSGGTVIHDKMIDDYMHLFAVKCKAPEVIRGLTIEYTLNRTPCVITFNRHNNIATGEVIQISNSPNAAINGTFYYEELTDIRGRLWRDKARTVPVMSADSIQSGGAVSRIFYNYAEPLYSDRKISDFEVSRADSPKVATADAFLKFTPNTTEITIDYMATPKVFVDCNDDSTNLELTYPTKLLYLLIDETILIYTSPSRDTLLNQLTTKEITP